MIISDISHLESVVEADAKSIRGGGFLDSLFGGGGSDKGAAGNTASITQSATSYILGQVATVGTFASINVSATTDSSLNQINTTANVSLI